MKEVIMQVQSSSVDYPKAPIYVDDLVRCKDCRLWSGNQETMHNNHLCRNWSKFGSINTSADDFCSYGVPKTI